MHSRSLTCSVLTLLIAMAFRPFHHVFKLGYEHRSSEENSSRASSRFPPRFVCAHRLRTHFLPLSSSRHISPPEESRRCELPCRGVHILRRSLADSLPPFHPVPLFSARPELTLVPSRAPHYPSPSPPNAPISWPLSSSALFPHPPRCRAHRVLDTTECLRLWPVQRLCHQPPRPRPHPPCPKSRTKPRSLLPPLITSLHRHLRVPIRRVSPTSQPANSQPKDATTLCARALSFFPL